MATNTELELSRLWAAHADLEREIERIKLPAGPGGGGGGKLRRMRVVSEGTDHLHCHTWDGSTEGTDDIVVAKPYKLRSTTGFFADDDEILATKVNGGTGVSGASWECVTQPPYWVANP